MIAVCVKASLFDAVHQSSYSKIRSSCQTGMSLCTRGKKDQMMHIQQYGSNCISDPCPFFFPRRCEPCRTWAVRTKGHFRRHSSIWLMQQKGEEGITVLCLINSWEGPLPRSQLPRGLFLAHQKSFLSPPLSLPPPFRPNLHYSTRRKSIVEVGEEGGLKCSGSWVKWPNSKHFFGGKESFVFSAVEPKNFVFCGFVGTF